VLTVSVVTLFGLSGVLVALTLLRKLWSRRLERGHQLLVGRYREPVEAFVIDGVPLHVEDRDADRAAVLDLILRYLSVLKGREADALIDYLDDQGYIEQAMRHLCDRWRWRRAEAAELLGNLRSPKSVPVLVDALGDPCEDVRTVAARSLASIRDPAAIPALADALNEPSRWTLSMVAENLMVMGAEAVPPLIALVDRGDAHNACIAAVQILGEIRDPRAVAPIVEVLHGAENLNMRAQAAAALGKLGGAAAEAALEDALEDPQWQVRAQAAKALGRTGNPGCAYRLAQAMPDTSWWVRVNCAEALASLGEVGRKHLENLLDSPDRYVRDQCVAALQVYGYPVVAAIPAAARRVPSGGSRSAALETNR
jgi:HEAT repeat protein